MENKKTLIEPIWFVKLLPIALIGFFFFLIEFYFFHTLRSGWFFIISLLLIFLAILWKTRFSLTFKDDFLQVRQLGGSLDIPYSKISKVYIRQSPFDKLLKIKSIIVKFDLPNEGEKAKLRAFGLSVNITAGWELPRTFGDLLIIPGLSLNRTDELKNEILLLSKKSDSDVINLGVGYPYYNNWIKISYFVVTLLFLIVIGFFILTILYYFYLQGK